MSDENRPEPGNQNLSNQADEPDTSQLPAESAPLADESAEAASAEAKPRWRDRSVGFTKVVVLTGAGLLLGGALGGTIGAVAAGDHHDRRGGHGNHGDRGPGGPGDRGGPGEMGDRGGPGDSGDSGDTQQESQTS